MEAAMGTRRLTMAALAMVIFVAPIHGQSPSDSCMAPIAEITLPLSQSGTLNWNDDVNFGVDIGAACAAGGGGTPAGQGGDFVYAITLGTDHYVDCSFVSPVINTSEYTVVLSSSCATPLAAGSCVWGQVVPSATEVSFNTADLGLAPGTYYFWFDRAPCCPAWQIQCDGTLSGNVFRDDFESGGTGNWSSTVP